MSHQAVFPVFFEIVCFLIIGSFLILLSCAVVNVLAHMFFTVWSYAYAVCNRWKSRVHIDVWGTVEHKSGELHRLAVT